MVYLEVEVEEEDEGFGQPHCSGRESHEPEGSNAAIHIERELESVDHLPLNILWPVISIQFLQLNKYRNIILNCI